MTLLRLKEDRATKQSKKRQETLRGPNVDNEAHNKIKKRKRNNGEESGAQKKRKKESRTHEENSETKHPSSTHIVKKPPDKAQ